MSLYAALRPLLFCLPPERAHRLTIRLLQTGLLTAAPPSARLARMVMGLRFPGPVGLAAGFDKDAEAVRGAFKLGAGFVEIGTVTPRPQPGNPRPRVFRLVRDRAVINRLGFNNAGHAAAARRLERLRAGGPLPGPLGVNIGANKDSADRIADYALGVRRFAALADYLTVNISSPNTPGLRALQSQEALDGLIDAVLEARAASSARPPILIKIAPDLDAVQIAAIAEQAGRVDGLIVSNTTVARPQSLRSRAADQAGGLSGRPLMAPATDCLKHLRAATDGRVPLIGVGGIDSAADVQTKLAAGADLVQLYTSLIYEGPGLFARINRALALDER